MSLDAVELPLERGVADSDVRPKGGHDRRRQVPTRADHAVKFETVHEGK